MNLDLVNQLSTPYEKWDYRQLLENEKPNSVVEIVRGIKTSLLAKVNNPLEAAIYMATYICDNGLEYHIEESLRNSIEFNNNIRNMPLNPPDSIISYKYEFPLDSYLDLHTDIFNLNLCQPKGQYLFHGGHWKRFNKSITTTRPISTSYCPQVALRNGEWMGKSYDFGYCDLWVIKINDDRIRSYVYSIESGELSNEKEVLLMAGISLNLIRIHKIPVRHKAYKSNHKSGLNILAREIDYFVLEIEATI